MSISYKVGYNGSFCYNSVDNLIGSFLIRLPIIGLFIRLLYKCLTVTKEGIIIEDYILNLSYNWPNVLINWSYVISPYCAYLYIVLRSIATLSPFKEYI